MVFKFENNLFILGLHIYGWNKLKKRKEKGCKYQLDLSEAFAGTNLSVLFLHWWVFTVCFLHGAGLS